MSSTRSRADLRRYRQIGLTRYLSTQVVKTLTTKNRHDVLKFEERWTLIYPMFTDAPLAVERFVNSNVDQKVSVWYHGILLAREFRLLVLL